MRRLALPTLVCLGLLPVSGCHTWTEPGLGGRPLDDAALAARDEAACRAEGLRPGSAAFARCRAAQVAEREAYRASMRRAVTRFGI
jgi:hypothetical protein